MHSNDVQPATRADWVGLAKLVGLIDLALLAGLLLSFALGGHA